MTTISNYTWQPQTWTCTDWNHRPQAMYLYIPPFGRYIHTCPSCGQETVIMGQMMTYGVLYK